MKYWNEFISAVSDLLETEQVKSLWNIKHHFSISLYEHSVFVAYTSFCVASRLGFDAVAIARAGLLHDFYLYDSEKAPQLDHCFNHASRALENAKKICNLSPRQENAILAHMWPLSRRLPRYRESVVVSLCDKYCASMETLHLWHFLRLYPQVHAI